MNSQMLVELTYLLSAILFVVGLKRLQSPGRVWVAGGPHSGPGR